VWWKGKGEIISGVDTVTFSVDERVERAVAVVVRKSVARSAVQTIVCNDRIVALKLKAEPVSTFINASLHANIGVRKCRSGRFV
jgi:hypothetical protein